MARSCFELAFKQVVGIPMIDNAPFPKPLQVKLEGKHDLQIIGWMQRVLVVFGMACPKVMMVVPTQKGEDPEKKPVEPACPENRVVNQLVKTIDQKMPCKKFW